MQAFIEREHEFRLLAAQTWTMQDQPNERLSVSSQFDSASDHVPKSKNALNASCLKSIAPPSSHNIVQVCFLMLDCSKATKVAGVYC